MTHSIVPRMRPSFESAIDRLFEEAFRVVNRGEAGWTPPCNVYQDGSGLTIEMALPGLTSQDIEMHIDNGVLTVGGSRKRDEQPKERATLAEEFLYGTFERSFSLPNGIDHHQVKASFKDGVLMVHCPLSEAAKPRRILIERQ